MPVLLHSLKPLSNQYFKGVVIMNTVQPIKDMDKIEQLKKALLNRSSRDHMFLSLVLILALEFPTSSSSKLAM
jgi:dihydroorotase